MVKRFIKIGDRLFEMQGTGLDGFEFSFDYRKEKAYSGRSGLIDRTRQALVRFLDTYDADGPDFLIRWARSDFFARIIGQETVPFPARAVRELEAELGYPKRGLSFTINTERTLSLACSVLEYALTCHVSGKDIEEAIDFHALYAGVCSL